MSSLTDQPMILIVDDAPSVALGLKKVLATEGYRAVVCTTVAETMEWMARYEEGIEERPAAMLIDIHLPDGSGLELAKLARTQLGDGLPVIVLSGDTSMENLRALPEAGASLFIAKPVHVKRLVEHIREWAVPTA